MGRADVTAAVCEREMFSMDVDVDTVRHWMQADSSGPLHQSRVDALLTNDAFASLPALVRDTFATIPPFEVTEYE